MEVHRTGMARQSGGGGVLGLKKELAVHLKARRRQVILATRVLARLEDAKVGKGEGRDFDRPVRRRRRLRDGRVVHVYS